MVHSAISGLDSVMPHIKQIPVGEATGLLKKLFDEALERAGRIWHIVHIMSLNPRALDSSMKHYVRAFATDPMEEGDVGGRHLEDERLLLLNSGARARPPGRGHGAVWE